MAFNMKPTKQRRLHCRDRKWTSLFILSTVIGRATIEIGPYKLWFDSCSPRTGFTSLAATPTLPQDENVNFGGQTYERPSMSVTMAAVEELAEKKNR